MAEKQIGRKTTIVFVSKQHERHTRKRKAQGGGCYIPEKLLARPGVGDVLNTDVDLLLHVAGLDALVDKDTDSTLGHVEDAASLAVVRLVRHTELVSTVALSRAAKASKQGRKEGRKEGEQIICQATSERTSD